MIAFHPIANLFPLVEGTEFDELVEDIRVNGVRDAILLHDGQILDGRNRFRALVRLRETGELRGAGWGVYADEAITDEDLDPASALWPFEKYSPLEQGDPLAFVISKNLHRRHLDESQRAMVAARIASLAHGQRQTGKFAGVPTQAEAAGKLKISERALRQARNVMNSGEPELVRAVDRGKLPVSSAAQATRLSADQQRRIAEEAEAGHANAVRMIIKRDSRETRERDLGDKQRALPAKRYGVILADPEWRFGVYSRETGMDRSADNHYPTSDLDVIKSRPVGEIAAEDCVLFLWATVPMLPQALTVMSAWGFAYRSQVIWSKDRIGTGYWFRNKHEILLLGTRGNVPAPAMGTQWESVITAPVGEHSAKPEIFLEMIEAYFPNLPKIELNARRTRPGWDAWGLEAPEEDRCVDLDPAHLTEPDGRSADESPSPLSVAEAFGEAVRELALSPSDETPDLQVARDVREEAAPTPVEPSQPDNGAASPSSSSGFADDLEIPSGLRRTEAA